MNTEHPGYRGRNNAIAIIDRHGVEAARKWLAERVANSTRPPLDPRYIAAFQRECE